MDHQYGKMLWTLLQDGASAHPSNETTRYLRQHHMYAIADWPSGSRDMNPIDHPPCIADYHDCHKHYVADYHPQTAQQLKDTLNLIWRQVIPNDIAALTNGNSMYTSAVVK
jgi:hypothetical protein